jgi:hypothetical protein
MDNMNENNVLQIKLDELAESGVNQGHQAEVFNADESSRRIIKIFNNPNAAGQKYAGSYDEARGLVGLMERYRDRLIAIGFPVPSAEEAIFSVGQLEASGAFVPVESVKNFGIDLEGLLAGADDQGKTNIVRMILEVSYPVLMAENIGADIKPANFVVSRETDQLLHIDPLPVLMLDENTGLALTEWPPIMAPEIQDFLRVTHLTPMAIGYRFYQELCQCDPASRSLFQRAITDVLNGWVGDGRIDREVAEQVMMAMVPESSRILAQMMAGEMSKAAGEGAIRGYIEDLSAPGSHPIYALREMAFLVTEQFLDKKVNFDTVTALALETVRRELGAAKGGKIEQAVRVFNGGKEVNPPI